MTLLHKTFPETFQTREIPLVPSHQLYVRAHMFVCVCVCVKGPCRPAHACGRRLLLFGPAHKVARFQQLPARHRVCSPFRYRRSATSPRRLGLHAVRLMTALVMDSPCVTARHCGASIAGLRRAVLLLSDPGRESVHLRGKNVAVSFPVSPCSSSIVCMARTSPMAVKFVQLRESNTGESVRLSPSPCARAMRMQGNSGDAPAF